MENQWYLRGYDRIRGDLRTFHRARIENPKMLTQRFERPSRFDVTESFVNSIGGDLPGDFQRQLDLKPTGASDEFFERFSTLRTPSRKSSSDRLSPGGRPRQHSGDEHSPLPGPRGENKAAPIQGRLPFYLASYFPSLLSPRLGAFEGRVGHRSRLSGGCCCASCTPCNPATASLSTANWTLTPCN